MSTKVGPNKRICAFLIDEFSVILLITLLSFLSIGILGSIIGIFYILFRDSFTGQGLGKMLVGLQAENDQGGEMSISQGLIRNIPFVLPIAGFFFWQESVISSALAFIPLIEYIAMRLDKDGKRIGDRLDHTKVRDLKPQVSDMVYLLASLGMAVAFFVFIFMSAKGAQNEKKEEVSETADENIGREDDLHRPRGRDRTLEEQKRDREFAILRERLVEYEVDSNFKLGAESFKNGDYQSAVDYLNEVLAVDPKNHEAHFYLSAAYMWLQNFSEAVQHYDTAISLGHPGDTEVANTLNFFRPREFNVSYPFPEESGTVYVDIHFKGMDLTKCIKVMENAALKAGEIIKPHYGLVTDIGKDISAEGPRGMFANQAYQKEKAA